MIIAVVVILVLIVLGLVVYNVNIHKKIQKFKNMNQKITNLYVVQDFMNAIGETSSVEEKIKKINDILIERYEIKFNHSSIWWSRISSKSFQCRPKTLERFEEITKRWYVQR